MVLPFTTTDFTTPHSCSSTLTPRLILLQKQQYLQAGLVICPSAPQSRLFPSLSSSPCASQASLIPLELCCGILTLPSCLISYIYARVYMSVCLCVYTCICIYMMNLLCEIYYVISELIFVIEIGMKGLGRCLSGSRVAMQTWGLPWLCWTINLTQPRKRVSVKDYLHWVGLWACL